MTGLTDHQLLRSYSAEGSEAAFAELVERHIDFVYSAALRITSDPHLAEDVTQGAFVALAQAAGKLGNGVVVPGWLYTTMRNIAGKAIRSEVRRRTREREAAAMKEVDETDSIWEQITPHLDQALGQLNEADRDALLLRYFQRQTARQIAQALGTSEEAAQKRVSRAIDRIRELLMERGVAVGADGLALGLSTLVVQTAPAALHAAITKSAITVASTSTFSLLKWAGAKGLAAASVGTVILGTGAALLLQSAAPKSQASKPLVTKAAAAEAVNNAGLVWGILKSPEGQPLPNVEVYLSTASVKVPVYTERSDKVQTTVTGPDGRFAFPEDGANRAAIVVHEKGYGQASVSELEKKPEIMLQPWAHIEGTLREGNKIISEQKVHLSRTRFGSKTEDRTYCAFHDTEATTDAQGHYSFDRVAPGDTWISWKKRNGDYDLQYRYVDVQPGESLTIDIGGRGRPISGKASLIDADNAAPVKFYGSVWPLTLHQMKRPPNWPELSPEEQERLTAQWEKTPDAKIYNQERCPIDFRLNTDGTFAVPDLPTGLYRVVVASWSGAPVRSQVLSRGATVISIPEIPGGRSDEVLDIGNVEAFYTRPLRQGELAPPFETSTLQGQPLKLADYRGKYVLLNFWRSDRPEAEEELPHIKAAYAKWKGDKRLAIIGMNFDESIETLRNMVEKQQLSWVHCVISKNSTLPARYRLRAPTTMLIGPDGKIVQPDLRGSQIEETLQEVLGKK